MRSTAATATVMLAFVLAACSGPPPAAEPEPSPVGASGSSSSTEEPGSSRPPRLSHPPSYAGEEVSGWPTTSRNRAGVYSWDGETCAGRPCVMGFMHNGYGSGDVSLVIQRARAGAAADDGWTTTAVAGRAARYRRTGPREEQWRVEIHGTTLDIALTTRVGTSEVELDEAHGIVGSLRPQRRDTDLGFRLVFRLVTDDWDSG